MLFFYFSFFHQISFPSFFMSFLLFAIGSLHFTILYFLFLFPLFFFRARTFRPADAYPVHHQHVFQMLGNLVCHSVQGALLPWERQPRAWTQHGERHSRPVAAFPYCNRKPAYIAVNICLRSHVLRPAAAVLRLHLLQHGIYGGTDIFYGIREYPFHCFHLFGSFPPMCRKQKTPDAAQKRAAPGVRRSLPLENHDKKGYSYPVCM